MSYKSALSMKTALDVIKSKDTSKLQKRLVANKEYNENILKDVPTEILNGETLDGNIIIRLFKFEAMQDNDGKLLEPKWKAFETEGGKWAAKIENAEYTSKGIVIKKPSDEFIKSLENKQQEYRYSKLEEGNILR